MIAKTTRPKDFCSKKYYIKGNISTYVHFIF